MGRRVGKIVFASSTIECAIVIVTKLAGLVRFAQPYHTFDVFVAGVSELRYFSLRAKLHLQGRR